MRILLQDIFVAVEMAGQSVKPLEAMTCLDSAVEAISAIH